MIALIFNQIIFKIVKQYVKHSKQTCHTCSEAQLVQYAQYVKYKCYMYVYIFFGCFW